MLTEVYEPVATVHRPPSERKVSPSKADARSDHAPAIEGQAIVIVINAWKSMYVLSEAIADRLRELGAKTVKIEHSGYSEGSIHQVPPEVIDKIGSNATAALVGLGN